LHCIDIEGINASHRNRIRNKPSCIEGKDRTTLAISHIAAANSLALTPGTCNPGINFLTSCMNGFMNVALIDVEEEL
jgi:hypothetical protein